MHPRRTLWAVRRRLLGPVRVVTGEQVAALARSGALGIRGRARIRALHVRELVLGPPRRARVTVGAVRLELGGGGDFAVDWKAFVEVFAGKPYAAPYADARVLDVGAHKGYFAAYALSLGARAVVSFEPEAANHTVLSRAAARFGDRWRVRQAAVGSANATGTLLLDRTSWAHSLLAVERPAGEQAVAIVTLEQALAELPAPGSRTIVKIDAEGAECGILARPEALAGVDLLLVEWHSNAPCTRKELARHITTAGLAGTASGDVLRFSRR